MGRYAMLKKHFILPIVAAGILLLAGSTYSGDEGGDPFRGGLIWNNWTDAVAGGSGYPEGYERKKPNQLRYHVGSAKS